jgi:protein-disulfide isomerase
VPSGTPNNEPWESRAARLGLPENIPESVTPQGFTGRWRIGPEDAPIRIVAFSDYQCPDCKRVEDEIKEILLTRDDVSFSHKHFPFNMECNPTFKQKRSPHPNACWAARAAEAAGVLRGNRGFWEMHFWLYDRKDAQGKPVQGSFTDPELIAGLTSLGYDPAEFQRVMQSEAAVEWIDDECLEGVDLGLMFTPLVYINGVEFRQWHAPGAIKRAVERVAAANPPRGLPTLDQPAKATAKAVEDWQVSYVWPPESLAREGFSMARGPADAPLHIIFWGDYEDEHSREMNKDVNLDFRHDPLHEDCNMFAEREDHTRACRMAFIAEGAGRLGGPEKFWQMHEWLMEQGGTYDEEAMKRFAVSIGLDPVELVQQAESPEVRQTIFTDCATLQKKLGGRFMPAIVVNWRLCPRWKLNDGRVVLNDVFEAAEKEVGLKD